MNYKIEISLDNNEKFSTFLHENIREFNNEHSIHHKEARKKEAVQPINIIVSDNKENWIGGLNADVYWNWLEINDFWFSEKYRGKGLGGLLLDKAEKIAKEKGAKNALLTTFEFQARSFYEIKGYQVVGEINDYPPGSSYYTMVKPLI
ncbi:GNAT family N-acetyltransferase [Cytobacillus solani]|uniref:GCN5 family acetyltransferase n=1 Tax=Cytobacillus solani TaxID=1637975 RepID=A0A0Q3T4L0_9BACI|nr:GNAT family N-acetyltransferase [Cytobacillus solani]KQL18365.1 GCN5 family acetyltransferase [Cytobacillus solani]USK56215.1 GNAT family N-acetyltransferase [Cytobacillus solani]